MPYRIGYEINKNALTVVIGKVFSQTAFVAMPADRPSAELDRERELSMSAAFPSGSTSPA